MNKKLLGLGLILLVVSIIIGGLVWSNQNSAFQNERLVYIRAIEGVSGVYTATVDYVEGSLPGETNEEAPTRAHDSLTRLSVASFSSITIPDRPDIRTVAEFQDLLLTKPVYTSELFTVTVVDGEITTIRHEPIE